MPIPNHAESTAAPVLSVPSVAIKKQNSTKNQLRKQSAKKSENPAAYISGGVQMRNTDEQNLQGLSHKSGSQAMPVAYSIVNGVAVVSTLQGQKGLKNQPSHKQIPSSPEKHHQKHHDPKTASKSKPNFFVEGADLGTADLNPGKVANNVSGLLNMSKQRACKLDAEPNLSQFSAVVSDD